MLNLKENGKQLCLLECKHTCQKTLKTCSGDQDRCSFDGLSSIDEAGLNGSLFTTEVPIKHRLNDAATIKEKRKNLSVKSCPYSEW